MPIIPSATSRSAQGAPAEKQPPDEHKDAADKSSEQSESNGTRYQQRYHKPHDPL